MIFLHQILVQNKSARSGVKRIFLILIFLTYCLVESCAVKPKLKFNENLNYIITDTLNLSGYLIYDDKFKSINFIRKEQEIIKDSLKFAKRSLNNKEKYFWMEPYKVHRFFKNINFCSMVDQEKYYLKTEELNGERYQILFISKEDFILINSEDNENNKLISFKCW